MSLALRPWPALKRVIIIIILFYVQLNTVRVAVVGRGVLHTEGGWPRDVNCRDPEQTARYRKKAERDEEFIAVRPAAVLLREDNEKAKVTADLLNLQVTRGLVTETEKWVKQNNSLNIFEEYFLEADPATDTAAATATTEAVFKDPQWTPERAVSPSCF